MKRQLLIVSFLLTGIMGALIGFKNAPERNSLKINNWNEWSEESLRALEYMILHYGEPDEKGVKMAIWYNCKPWKWTIVYSDAISHDFPETHKDVIEQCMNYRVPYYLFDEISRFNGSIECSRTRGEITVRCANEAMNFLAINMVSDLVSGKTNVKSAREFFADAAGKYMNSGLKDPYMKGIVTARQYGPIADPDSRPQPVSLPAPGGLSTK